MPHRAPSAAHRTAPPTEARAEHTRRTLPPARMNCASAAHARRQTAAAARAARPHSPRLVRRPARRRTTRATTRTPADMRGQGPKAPRAQAYSHGPQLAPHQCTATPAASPQARPALAARAAPRPPPSARTRAPHRIAAPMPPAPRRATARLQVCLRLPPRAASPRWPRLTSPRRVQRRALAAPNEQTQAQRHLACTTTPARSASTAPQLPQSQPVPAP